MSYWDRLNLFDKICAALGCALGVVLLILGTLGLCVGCNAHFTLPPVLGVLPALVGWGILKSAVVAFRSSRMLAAQGSAVPVLPVQPYDGPPHPPTTPPHSL